MPLEKDYSLVADSTTSESIDEPAPPVISRPIRTYGRKTERNAVASDSQSSFAASRSSVHHTAPPGLSEEIPPSSPNTDMSDSDVPSFTFGWREKAKALDAETDKGGDSTPSISHWRTKLDVMDGPASAQSSTRTKSGPRRDSPFDGMVDSFDGTVIDDATDAPMFGKSSLIDDTFPTHSQATLIPSQTPDDDEDVFVSLSTKRSPLRRSSPPKSFALSSPPPASGHTRSRKRAVVHDSDSDDNIPSTTPASTKDLFAVPNTGSSGTHITSDDEELPGSILQSRAYVKETPAQEDPEDAADEAVKGSPHAKPADEKKRKSKKPTKQEQLELIKERGRLAEQRAISVQQSTNAQKYSVSNLLTKVQRRKRNTDLLRTYPSSDPIESFSSPAKDRRDAIPAQMMQLWTTIGQSQPAAVLAENTEPELPAQPSNAAPGKDRLKEFKKKVLEQRRPSAAQVEPEGDDDEDDLEIVSPGKASSSRQRIDASNRSAEKPRVSEARKKQMQMAKITAPTKVQSKVPAVRTSKDIQTKLVPGKVSQQELNRILAAGALKDAQEAKRLKEEHWTKYGGKLRKDTFEVEGGLEAAVEVIAQQGLQAAQKRQARLERGEPMEEDEEAADSGDEDWAPAGSGSEAEADLEEGDANNEDEDSLSPALDDDAENLAPIHGRRGKARAIITSDSEGENDENTPKVGKRPAEYRRGTSEALTGDENDKENNTNLMYDRSEDKENTAVVRHVLTSPRLSLPLGRRTLRDLDTLRRDGSDSQDGARSPLKELLSEEEMAASQLAKGLTQSFEERLNQASPLSLSLPPRVAGSRSSGRGGDVSATKDADTDMQMPPPAFLPLFNNQGPADMLDFSQAESQPGFKSLNLGGGGSQLGPGFADLFESGTQGAKKDLFDEALRAAPGNGGLLPPPPVFNFTQEISDAARLAPAFVDKELQRRGQEVIDGHQARIAEAAAQSAPPPETEVFINDLGFLTQTRPVPSPEVALRRANGHITPFLARSSIFDMAADSMQDRTPLRTLSFASHLHIGGETPSCQGDDDEDDSSSLGTGKLTRLRKARDGSPITSRLKLMRGSSSSSSSSEESLGAAFNPKRKVTFRDAKGKGKEKAKRNAFDVLGKGVREQERRHREAIANEYLEEQAAESDEDAGFGFGARKRGDEEEDGEELDGTLHELMDDQTMDQGTLAAQRVHEKYMELAKEDDERLEALHRDATTGALRRKRKNGGIGVDSDDSDDEDEDGENDRAKRKMKRLRVSNRSDIRHLAKNEATRAFAETYNHSLKDDDDEFAYLQQDQYLMDEDTAADGNRRTRQGEDEGDDEEEDEEDENQFITPEEIRARAREMQMEGVVETMDPNDVSWMDQQMEGDVDDDSGDDHPNGKKATSRPAVKTISGRKRAPQGNYHNPPGGLDIEMALGSGFTRQAPKGDAKMMNETNKQWYKQEYKSRNAGTSRSVGASAVTGHAKKGGKGGRDGRGGREKMEGGSGGVVKAKGVKAARSMLAVVANKDGLFE